MATFIIYELRNSDPCDAKCGIPGSDALLCGMYSLASAFKGFLSSFVSVWVSCGLRCLLIIDGQLLRSTGGRWLCFVALALRSSCLPAYVIIIETC